MELGLKGKVAMVAGASRGLGFAVARALAQEGVLVSIASSNAASIGQAAKQIEALGVGGAFPVAANLRSAADIAQWHRATVEHFGPVDLLVTNAGGPPAGPLLSFDDR